MDNQTLAIVVIAAAYLLLCVRIARHAGRLGRSAVAWFFITLFFTAVPAVVLFVGDALKKNREKKIAQPRAAVPHVKTADAESAAALPEEMRCPHCGRRFKASELDKSGGAPACPKCGMFIDEARNA